MSYNKVQNGKVKKAVFPSSVELMFFAPHVMSTIQGSPHTLGSTALRYLWPNSVLGHTRSDTYTLLFGFCSTSDKHRREKKNKYLQSFLCIL